MHTAHQPLLAPELPHPLLARDAAPLRLDRPLHVPAVFRARPPRVPLARSQLHRRRQVLDDLARTPHAALAVREREVRVVLVEPHDRVLVQQLRQENGLVLFRARARPRARQGLRAGARVQRRVVPAGADGREPARRGGVVARALLDDLVEVGVAAEEHVAGPAGEDFEFLRAQRDLAGATTDDGGRRDGQREQFVLEKGALEVLLHEDEILGHEGVGGRDEGGTDGCKGFGNTDEFLFGEATAEEDEKAVERFGVGIGLFDIVIDLGGIFGGLTFAGG